MKKVQKVFMGRAQFVAAAKSHKTKAVDVPELGPGAVVIVRELTARRALEIGAAIRSEARVDAMILWVIAAAVDEAGAPLFTEAEDREMLAEMPASVILRLSNAAIALNGFSSEATEETEKN